MHSKKRSLERVLNMIKSLTHVCISRRIWVIFFSTLTALVNSNKVISATFTGTQWAEGEVTWNVDFSNPPSNLVTNGNPDFDNAFIEAAALWSNSSTFRFNIDTSSPVDPCEQESNSQLNGATFSNTVCGTNFQSSSTLAVTRTFSSGTNNIRSGIIFNTAVTWDVYNGNLTSDQEFRRVAVHELGHALGLGHETRFPAIMAPTISNTIEQPQADDIGGVATLYDSDNDGIGVFEDNCPDTANPDQSNIDSNADSIGDACDPDIDNDGIFNSTGVDQQLALDNASSTAFIFGGNIRFAQTLTSNVDGNISQIRVPITCESSTLTIRLLQLEDGILDNSDPEVASIEISSATNASNSSFLTISFDENNAHLTSVGEQLAIIAESSGNCGWFTTPSNQGIPSYEAGSALSSFNGGNWQGSSVSDFPFATIITPVQIDNCPFTFNADQSDNDNDGQGDACQTSNDMDSDGVENSIDNCPSIANALQTDLDLDNIGDACDEDDDGDNIFDINDNCPLIINSTQDDTDEDGVGDLCDSDIDGDNIENDSDNCPLTPNTDQSDLDQDGEGNECDSIDDRDDDGDGSIRELDSNDEDPLVCSDIDADNCDDCSQGQFDTENDGLDTDTNGQCNLGDIDDDGDLINDTDDNCPLNVNPDQADENQDGIGDACETIDQDTAELCVPIRAANGSIALVCI